MYSSRRQSGPPSWFVFLIGLALVFGMFRLWVGVQTFFQTGGLLVATATVSALVDDSVATSDSVSSNPPLTRFPTMTPLPSCQDYTVKTTAGVINVRAQPSTIAEVLQTFNEGDVVCVLQQEGEWYYVDRDTTTRRIEEGYVFIDLLESVNGTPTPTASPLGIAPTITLTPTITPTATPKE